MTIVWRPVPCAVMGTVWTVVRASGKWPRAAGRDDAGHPDAWQCVPMPSLPRPAEYQIHDERFFELIVPGAELRELHGGGLWTEGPAYLPARDEVWWSDVCRNRCLRVHLRDRRGVARGAAGATSTTGAPSTATATSCSASTARDRWSASPTTVLGP